MVECLQPVFVLPGGLLRRFVLTLVAIAVGTNTASAQITPQMLIGDAVSEISGNRYADVDEAIKRFANRDFLGARHVSICG